MGGVLYTHKSMIGCFEIYQHQNLRLQVVGLLIKTTVNKKQLWKPGVVWGVGGGGGVKCLVV